MKRKTLYFFRRQSFNSMREYFDEDGIQIFSISEFVSNPSRYDDLYLGETVIIDLSAILWNKESLQSNIEILDQKFPESTRFIADKKYQEDVIYEFRYVFDEFSDIENEIDIPSSEPDEIVKPSVRHRKIVDLNEEDITSFVQSVNQGLYGHEGFKSVFSGLIENFRLFNKLGEHKVLSLFLMGDSGVGKTELARVIHKSLDIEGNSKMAKVNFGNYSSDHSLSSLIGSPRGYRDSEDGEIFIRVSKSKVGLILIDEFEKGNSRVFDFFLAALENGSMTNSLSGDVDINGFIIVFTSNISKSDFHKRISPELRSRFDHVAYFHPLFEEDKDKFTEFRVNDIVKKYNRQFSTQIAESEIKQILSRINVKRFKNMRDLNKEIKDVFVKYIKNETITKELD